jgi:iron complex transport system substrate-binding protein
MSENEVATIVVDAADHIHVEHGPGLLESVYEAVLAKELEKRGRKVERQKPIAFEFRGARFDEGFRADLMVNSLVIVELKSIEHTGPVHKSQRKT